MHVTLAKSQMNANSALATAMTRLTLWKFSVDGELIVMESIVGLLPYAFQLHLLVKQICHNFMMIDPYEKSQPSTTVQGIARVTRYDPRIWNSGYGKVSARAMAISLFLHAETFDESRDQLTKLKESEQKDPTQSRGNVRS